MIQLPGTLIDGSALSRETQPISHLAASQATLFFSPATQPADPDIAASDQCKENSPVKRPLNPKSCCLIL